MMIRLAAILFFCCALCAQAVVLRIGGNPNDYSGPIDRVLGWDGVYRSLSENNDIDTKLVSSAGKVPGVNGWVKGVGGVICDDDSASGSGLTMTVIDAYDASTASAPKILASNNLNLLVGGENKASEGDWVSMSWNQDVRLLWTHHRLIDQGETVTFSWGNNTVTLGSADCNGFYFNGGRGVVIRAGQVLTWSVSGSGAEVQFRDLIVETVPELDTLGFLVRATSDDCAGCLL